MQKKVNTKKMKLITCYLTAGRGLPLVRKLHEIKKLDTANVNLARGAGLAAPKFKFKLDHAVERDVLNIIVEETKANDIFEYIYFECELDKMPGGLLTQITLPHATEFTIPKDLPEEK